MSNWAIAIAIGLSFTKPSDMTLDLPDQHTHETYSTVHWSDKSFVTPFYYVVRIQDRNVAIDFTHYKIYAHVHETVHESGTWKGAPVDGDITLNQRVQHIEVSHGVNSLGLVGIVYNSAHRGMYIGGGPVVYLPHVESTVDGRAHEWGYAFGGTGFETFVGTGMPAPFVELKHDQGTIKVGIGNEGTATIPLSTTHLSIAP